MTPEAEAVSDYRSSWLVKQQSICSLLWRDTNLLVHEKVVDSNNNSPLIAIHRWPLATQAGKRSYDFQILWKKC